MKTLWSWLHGRPSGENNLCFIICQNLTKTNQSALKIIKRPLKLFKYVKELPQDSPATTLISAHTAPTPTVSGFYLPPTTPTCSAYIYSQDPDPHRAWTIIFHAAFDSDVFSEVVKPEFPQLPTSSDHRVQLLLATRHPFWQLRQDRRTHPYVGPHI